MRLPAIDQKADRKVREAVIKRIAKTSKDNLTYLIENMPGLKGQSGRARLAFYRATTPEYWEALAARFPAGDYSALALMRDWRDLSRQYPERPLNV